ncbi:ABC transporter substrate-binding protein [Psychromonas marina]|uniref:ABC transporter substrate-binding protein n=1 Tax=Psychromonas marina TaxID=88364 RepID=A0ABQ6DWJ3_9GAMM|nr:extracellular solute-binding protein [Psychromonas marina]GLS89523.1 ABC transporter substrate-binding protein [Psychromonas marina]
MIIKIKIILQIILITNLLLSSVNASALTVSILIAPKQRSVFSETFKQFTQKTGIEITTIARTDTDYKNDLPTWLLDGIDTPDVLYWQASQRLFDYVKKDAIQPITHLWNEGDLDENFLHLKDSVTYEGAVYALPISYYYWGIFYKRSLLEKYGEIPKTWQEFIDICESMKRDGITPIGIGLKNNWPAAAWFDYLNLRINGYQFHQKTLQGKVSFYDKRLQNVMIEWKKLIDNSFFNKNNKRLKWNELLPSLYRDKIGFMLIGSFSSKYFPVRMSEELAVMAFPKMAMLSVSEEAPLEVFMIAKNTKNLSEAEIFIKFMADAKVQADHNQRIGYIPANNKAKIGTDHFTQAGVKILNQANSITQYFDRDSLPEFEKKVIPLLAEFINTGDIKSTTQDLEQARKEAFINTLQ